MSRLFSSGGQHIGASVSSLYKLTGGFPVVQRLRICLPVQEVQVDPWSGKIPHEAGQQSQHTVATAPARLEPVLHNRRSHGNGKSLLTAVREGL